ncbi:uncharacterized protein LOC130548902 isoform X1 [Triplophysa rosa]|uniref:uncharacterized protein LOC130548902 isoform X1 n=1 Tax=Triplophysa rosa TaxID=992332 RepID=UPI002545E111|nr:uncharacterized protein LOC130548902 isoform X1 [Triplophysa rosa]
MGFNSAIISLILLMNVEDFLTSEPIRVICEHKNICALSDTDVTLRCSYSNISIKTGFWFSHKQSQNWTESDEPEDIALDFDYSGRVKQQITIRQSDLTIRDVRERDSGEYQIMFIMKDGVKHISSVTVHLTVTENQSKEDVQSSEKRTRTQITIVMLSMLLILAVIGVLTYRFLRRRKHNSSQKRDNTKVEPHPSTSGNVAPQSTVSDFTHRTDSEEQDLHYSCVSFKQSDKSTSSTHTVIYSSAEDVHYATVKVK